MRYLMIENKGVAPRELFSLIGASMSRGEESTIGKHGSGSKYSVNVLLRVGAPPIIFCGNLRMEYGVVQETIRDGVGERTFDIVQIHLSGKNESGKMVRRTEKKDWTLDMGWQDWGENVDMAMREIISNAIDRSVREGRTADDVIIEVVNENQVRAKAGTTRVFVPYTDQIMEYHFRLPQYFLHFGNHAHKEFIENKNGEKVRVYKQGILVHESLYRSSFFHYQLDNIHIGENRKVDSWEANHSICDKVNSAPYYVVARVMEHVPKTINNSDEKDKYAEFSNLSNYKNEENKDVWQAAYNHCFPQHVLCAPGTAEFVRKKGYQTLTLDGTWYDILKKKGVKCDADVLNKNEIKGKTVKTADERLHKAVKKVWEYLEAWGLTSDKEFPPVHQFNSIMEGGSEKLGYYEDGAVYIHEQLVSGEGTSLILQQTILEELAHHITGSTDNSRDFQDFAFRVAATLMS